ncbi:MAG: SAM-dependent methyltransferase, partial [Fervidobacterium sp.]
MSWLKVVGIGPGKVDYLTIRAYKVLTNSEIILGYKRYLDLIKDEFSSKELIDSDMGDEKERVKKAIKFYLSGKKVAIVSGGDAGLYGIASVAI